MVHTFLSPRLLILVTFLASVTFVQFRGRVRHKLSRLVADHANLLAPYNSLMYLFSAVKAKPYADVRDFPELKQVTEQWQMIREEALKLFDEGHIRAASGYNDIGFNTFFKRGWKRFYLKWYGDFLPSASALCPRTAELLGKIPSINAAMFTLLPPGSRLGAHRDPFAGSLRYHLGLVTPNSPDCYIIVDGEKYYWKDGEAVMFDETYIHQAENRTDVTRVILFCDIERPMSNPVLRWINRVIGHGMIRAAATQNVPGEHVGVLNHIFAYLYQIRALGIRIKDWHKPLYYLLKWLLIGAIGYAIVVGF
ncbi:aspartyl/asparaginyl beta-hydroxylase domain-containing protein [Peristeroidobacter soli]|uniref:aspartyl/asparaginyl beta-hydroxylase domain-containing protein n=1 Tax=Peristeroidobacter soli TaxID=2497877 RepID=UPI00101B6159|nr:aspartyl/asparaginyl beta-hydroxylase domain-containing protein [Peristeroidobacter soli]